MRLPKVVLNPNVKYKKKTINIEVSTDASDAELKLALVERLDIGYDSRIYDPKSTGEPEQMVAIEHNGKVKERRFSVHQILINTHQ